MDNAADADLSVGMTTASWSPCGKSIHFWLFQLILIAIYIGGLWEHIFQSKNK